MTKELEISRLDDNRVFFLGVYQIASGIYGAIQTALLLSGISSRPFAINLLLLLGVGLFLFSFYCGYLLIKRRILEGLNLTTYCLMLQVFTIYIVGYKFSFVSGFYLSLYLDLTSDVLLGFNLNFSSLAIGQSGSEETIFISVNLVSIFLLSVIGKIKERIAAKSCDSVN